jgi:hypothetical protein
MFNVRIAEWVNSNSFKKFFNSLSWFGITYLIFSRFIQQFYISSSKANWYTLFEIFIIFIVYLTVIIFIFLYQLLNVFNFKDRHEVAKIPFFWVAPLIFGPVIINVSLYFLLPGWSPFIYEIILIFTILIGARIFDVFLKRKYDVKLSGFLFKVILLVFYFIFIIKSNVNPILSHFFHLANK